MSSEKNQRNARFNNVKKSPKPSIEDLTCTICNVTGNSSTQLKMHFASLKHSEKVKASKRLKSKAPIQSSSSDTNSLYLPLGFLINMLIFYVFYVFFKFCYS